MFGSKYPDGINEMVVSFSTAILTKYLYTYIYILCLQDKRESFLFRVEGNDLSPGSLAPTAITCVVRLPN
jgi:hypothetical protein